MKKDASKALVIAGIALFFTLTCGIAPSLTILPQIFPVLNQIKPFATITLIFIGFFIGIWVIATWVIAPWLKKPPGKPQELQEIRHLLAQGKRPAAKQKASEVTHLEEYQLDAFLTHCRQLQRVSIRMSMPGVLRFKSTNRPQKAPRQRQKPPKTGCRSNVLTAAAGSVRIQCSGSISLRLSVHTAAVT